VILVTRATAIRFLPFRAVAYTPLAYQRKPIGF
jgi:hypothetical protein